MHSDRKSPTLIDSKGMGGVIAQDGFDYQLWDGLIRLPAWLANPGFEQLIFEGLEDLEARFFAPHAPRHYLLERYQAKSGNLSPGDVRGVVNSFREFETAYAQTARVQTLVTPRLPPSLSWLSRVPARVRNARPFYAPFSDVLSANDDALRTRLESDFGEGLGGYVAESIDFEERSLPDRNAAVASFGLELERVFSIDVGARRFAAAFEALENLVRRSTGIPIERTALVGAVEEGLGTSLPLPRVFRLHVRSDRNETDDTALEVDAAAFSGGAMPFPPPPTWKPELLEPLERTARWLRSRGISRVSLGGSYRLTTAMMLGWSFRSAVGFELEVPTREGAWSTDSRPDLGDPVPGWTMTPPAGLHDDQLAVTVGVLRDPGESLRETAGIPDALKLCLHLDQPIVSAPMAQASASFVKRSVDAVAARFRPQGISLYMAGPAAFSVVLGHRWNALPPTRLHEFLRAESRYVETASLS